MNQAGVKKYIAVIWVLLITLTFSCLGLLVSNLVLNIKTENDNVSAADLTISSLSDLQSFANKVNGGDNFSGKTVVLSNDINCGGAGIGIGVFNSYFQGKFNGNGKTISNYSPNSYVSSNQTFDNHRAYGLFTKVDSSTIIENLRIINSGRSISGGDYKYVGGIVGFSNGATIRQCSVENFTISTTDKTDRIYVSGIFATGYATVNNCYVANLKVNNGCGASAGIGCAYNYFKTNSDVYGSVTTFEWLKKDSTLSSCIVRGFSGKYSFITDKAYSSGATSPYNHKITNCYTVSHMTTGLYCSSVGGTSGSYWYYAAEYNDGFPMLRSFMSWKDVTFNANDSTMGSVSTTTISIPSDANEKSSSTTASIVVYGRIVTATPNTGYKVTGWTANSATSYTANFAKISFYLQFNIVNQVTPVCVEGSFVDASLKTIEISGTETVEVGCEYEDGKTIVYYEIGDYRVEYHFDPKYTIADNADYGNIQLDRGYGEYEDVSIINIANYYKSMKVEFRYSINNIKLSLKTYGSQWGDN